MSWRDRTPTLDVILKEIEKLKKTEKLLDDILYHYDIYSGEFTFKSEEENRKLKKRMHPDKLHSFESDKENLNWKIREYLNFDDSE